MHDFFRRIVLKVLISTVDDRLRNHGFLRRDSDEWPLSPVYDLNPTPTDIRPRILTPNIDLDEASCSLDVVEGTAEYFGLGLADARRIIGESGRVVATRRDVARQVRAHRADIKRKASAFEHDDLARAQAM